MATVEVLFKVGDSANMREAYAAGVDGMVITLAPLGMAWSPNTVLDYLDNSAIPPNWSTLSDFERQSIKWLFDYVRWMTVTGRTPQEIADIRFPGWDLSSLADQQDTLDLCQDLISEAEQILFNMTTYGFDTNWGVGDLTSHGVLLMDLTDDQILRYQKQASQFQHFPGLHVAQEIQPKAKRWWRVKYETYFNPSDLAKLADPSILLPVKRTAQPVLPQNILEEI